MVRAIDLDEQSRKHILGVPCPEFAETAFVVGPPLARRRVALISTAGLHRRNDRPFAVGANDYRAIPGDTPAADLVMSHVSTNYDRTGFQQDLNVVLPLDRLRELVADGAVGAVAAYHYSFMGATDPTRLEATGRHLAGLLKADQVDAVVLLPV
ncbi:MAG: selenoprotein B glycine/betaine/sarcosine/D-proline reductase [Alphaproteobacteria bacterium]|nr:selenoprotein B glycine/betaine/sarcosine/D-proline reductase [Alphaproteobacteria bacterium]